MSLADHVALFAVDPGETTGWAAGYVQVGGGSLEVEEHGEISCAFDEFGSDGVLELADEASHWFAQADADAARRVLVIEDFTLRHGVMLSGRSALSPVRVASGLVSVLLDRMLLLDAVRWQSASDAKGVITDERLKRMGLWIKGKPHARDAVRHLVIAGRKIADDR